MAERPVPAGSGNRGHSSVDVSVVIVSFETRDMLRECLYTAFASTGISLEILVVDNASRDGSAEMVEAEFPAVRLFRAQVNLGFAGANNLAIPESKGRYVVLLNSDAFLAPDTLAQAVALMDGAPTAGVGGARLIGRDGEHQPSSRTFPSLLGDWLTLSGLSYRFPHSRIFGFPDRTWADQHRPSQVDWVVGAFLIVRGDAIQKVGLLDTRFFLYYEEVDWCRRFQAAGYTVEFFPQLTVVHVGGESSKSVSGQHQSKTGRQLSLWRSRSALLYYRKHHGQQALGLALMESTWHWMRAMVNFLKKGSRAREKMRESYLLAAITWQAWRETRGGRVSPEQPW